MRCIGIMAAMATLMVGACTVLPPSDIQDFSVSGSVAAPQPALFLNTDPTLTATLAKQSCADHADVLGTSMVPSDKGDIGVAHVSCTRYRPFIVIPYVSEHLY